MFPPFGLIIGFSLFNAVKSTLGISSPWLVEFMSNCADGVVVPTPT